MKSFFIGKHVPYIPPSFENNEYIEDLKNKAELFNSLTVNITNFVSQNIWKAILS